MKLRPYQIDDLRRIENSFEEDRAILYQAPTGSGKTILFVDLIRSRTEAGERVLILAHTNEIVEQSARALRRSGIDHGIIAAGYPDTKARVQIASVMTLARRRLR